MNLLLKISKCINQLNLKIGHMISWLTLLLVALNIIVVLLRYLLGSNSLAIQESIGYVHAIIFMLGLAYTMQRGGHVRVDIFYRGFSKRRQALIDLIGAVLFLLPFCGLILFGSWDYVLVSWKNKETSSEVSGLSTVYLLKTLMIIMPITLALQGIAQIIESFALLKNVDSNSSAKGGS